MSDDSSTGTDNTTDSGHVASLRAQLEALPALHRQVHELFTAGQWPDPESHWLDETPLRGRLGYVVGLLAAGIMRWGHLPDDQWKAWVVEEITYQVATVVPESWGLGEIDQACREALKLVADHWGHRDKLDALLAEYRGRGLEADEDPWEALEQHLRRHTVYAGTEIGHIISTYYGVRGELIDQGRVDAASQADAVLPQAIKALRGHDWEARARQALRVASELARNRTATMVVAGEPVAVRVHELGFGYPGPDVHVVVSRDTPPGAGMTRLLFDDLRFDDTLEVRLLAALNEMVADHKAILFPDGADVVVAEALIRAGRPAVRLSSPNADGVVVEWHEVQIGDNQVFARRAREMAVSRLRALADQIEAEG